MKKIDWFKFGQDIATGKKGTGWMAVSDSDIKDALKEEGDTVADKFSNHAEGWKETLQWEYEVGNKMTPLKSDDDVDKRLDEENEFFWGYTNVMLRKAKKLKKLSKVI